MMKKTVMIAEQRRSVPAAPCFCLPNLCGVSHWSFMGEGALTPIGLVRVFGVPFRFRIFN